MILSKQTFTIGFIGTYEMQFKSMSGNSIECG